MKRRDFITLLGGAATALPLSVHAQLSGGPPRVGYLAVGSEDDPEQQTRRTGFIEALEKLRWVDGRNIHIEYYWGPFSAERLQQTAAALVGLAPNVIVMAGTPSVEAFGRKTRTIPIIFVGVTDPLASGLVQNMARPGGNRTGFANYEFAIAGKWLSTLKEVAPGLTRVLIILLPGDVSHQGYLRTIETEAPGLGVQPVVAAVSTAPEIERAISAFAQEPNGGALVLPGSPGFTNRGQIIGLASRHRLPVMYTHRIFIASGGLMSYDTDIVDLYRHAASYVDRILRGENPGDLPVQLPTKYDLAINLKTAKTLGLTVPPTLLALADEVIE